MDLKHFMSELIGRSYPPAISIGGRLRREWVARSVRPLPTQQNLLEMQATLEDAVFADISSSVPGVLTPELAAVARPALMLLRLDEFHLIARIDVAGPDCSIGTAAMIGTWGLLQAIDRQIELEDLEGLPVSCWKLLQAGRENRGSQRI